MTFRAPSPSDDEALAAVLNLAKRIALDADGMKDRRERWSRVAFFELLAECDGEIVGCMEIAEFGTGTANLRIIVKPEWRGKGIGGRLYDLALAHEAFAGVKLFAEVRDNDPSSLRFAEARGFLQKSHAYESTLDLSTFDGSSLEPYVARAREKFRIATVAELGDDDENRYRLWEIEHITDHDIPGVDTEELPTWETAKTILFTAKWYDPAGEFVALDDDRWVGVCGVAEFPGSVYYNQHTAVLKEYRGYGLATALKVLATDYVKKRGGKMLRTNNHAGNDPMLAINRKFGYQPEPGWYELRRERNS